MKVVIQMTKLISKEAFDSLKEEKKKELELLKKQYKLTLKLANDKKDKGLSSKLAKVTNKRQKTTTIINKMQKDIFGS